MITPTPAQTERFNQFLAQVAKEPVESNHFDGGFDAFTTSELGAHRIGYQYRYCGPDNVKVFFSENLKTWTTTVYNPAPSK